MGERGRVTLTDDGKWLILVRAFDRASIIDVIGRMAPLEDFLVLDGVALRWSLYLVSVSYRGTVGWIAEGAEGQYLSAPQPIKAAEGRTPTLIPSPAGQCPRDPIKGEGLLHSQECVCLQLRMSDEGEKTFIYILQSCDKTEDVTFTTVSAL